MLLLTHTFFFTAAPRLTATGWVSINGYQHNSRRQDSSVLWAHIADIAASRRYNALAGFAVDARAMLSKMGKAVIRCRKVPVLLEDSDCARKRRQR